MSDSNKKSIFVSSAVYGFEDMLDQIYAILDSLGYEVWMSHKGTIPIDPNLTALDSCLASVDKCDFFLGLILPRYGSGIEEEGENAITHEELLQAIYLNKKRWFLAHEHVIFSRTLLGAIGFNTIDKRKQLSLNKKTPIQDLRVIDMYEAAILNDINTVKERKGNWVQKFTEAKDANLFVSSQFRHVSEAIKFIDETVPNQKGEQ